MGNSRLDNLKKDLRTAINRHFASHRHGTLLAAIIAAFVVRPLIGETRTGDVLVGAMMLLLLLLVALYNIDAGELVGERDRLRAQNRRLRVLGWVLAAAAAGSRLPDIFVHSRILNLVVSICWLLFILFVTVNELRAVLKQREVTGETICAAISVAGAVPTLRRRQAKPSHRSLDVVVPRLDFLGKPSSSVPGVFKPPSMSMTRCLPFGSFTLLWMKE